MTDLTIKHADPYPRPAFVRVRLATPTGDDPHADRAELVAKWARTVSESYEAGVGAPLGTTATVTPLAGARGDEWFFSVLFEAAA